jgi:hypothetical protein
MIHQLITSIFADSFYSLLEYLITNERFIFKNFSRVFTRFYSSCFGPSLNETTSFLSSAEITVVVDFSLKIVRREIKKNECLS